MAFLLALVAHLPVTPLFPLLRVLRRAALLREDRKDWDYQTTPEDFSVPLELVNLPPKEPPKGGDEGFSLPPPPPPPGAKPPAGATEKGAKAEAPKQAPQAVKLGASEEKPDEHKDDGDKSDDGPGAKKKKSKGKKDERAKKDDARDAKETVGIRGTKDDKVVGKPNVTLAMWFPPMRGHALTGVVDKLFACSPEWRPFVQQGIKPLVDLEGVMVVGPQIADSSKMTVAVQHHFEGDQMHKLADAIVQKSGARGAWLKDEVARVVLLRRERVMFPHEKDMVFITPPDAWQPIVALTEPLSLPPANGRALSLTLLRPARPLRKLGLSLPDRITEMKLDVFANPDGSADMQIDFELPDEDKARADAPVVTKSLSALFSDLSQVGQTVDLLGDAAGDAKLKLPEVSFDPVEKRITGAIHFQEPQTAKMLALLAKVVCPKPRARGAASAPAP